MNARRRIGPRSGWEGRAKRVAIAGGVIALLWAAPALGAQRYASPTGDASDTTCPDTDPCDLNTAVEHSSVQDGDEVIVEPGNYTLGPSGSDEIDVNKAIDVHGEAGQPRPKLTASTFIGVWLASSGSVRHLEIEHTGSFSGVYVSAGTAADLIVHSTSSMACAVAGTVTIRDSVCWDTVASNGSALAVNSLGGSHDITLRNVTAVATATGSHGVLGGGAGGASIVMDAKGVIADGVLDDVRATADDTSSSVISLDHSNYATESEVGEGTRTVTDPGSGTNQTAAPVFVNAGTGDFHQTAASPTIDDGDTDASSGASDIDGDSRVLDGDDDCTAVADIGADEFVDATPPDCTPPETIIDRHPKRVIRTRKRRVVVHFRFSSDDPNATFDCRLDGHGAEPCTSPLELRVGRGRHELEIRAHDLAANVDPTPASFSWRVKRRH